ncbi:HAD family hydrolase [Alicyclobacillus sp. ALC3]|uniref:HAD family hydrolase n=1 Tax=Alicyclobacillus sp. ALC3 TaxID=2796143 RepID=UPI002378858C|nr:HAD-IA family hydrolase [Alicyclobacillus sp. ALC3]WDL96689.1 HAD-IA family hydrolase [Alicyclobacillus sp. ALC3]
MKAFLFDLDGTLHDSESLGSKAYSVAIQTVLGRKLSEEERIQLMGKPFSVLSELFPGQEGLIVEQTLSFYEQRNHEIEAYPGVSEVLEHLKARNYRMGVVTSKLKRNALKELRCTGLIDNFEVILTQEDTVVHKPDPLPLLVAAQKMGLTPAECFYIGDQPTDIEASNAAGMRSIAALWGEGQLSRMSPFQPEFIAQTPADVFTIVMED